MTPIVASAGVPAQEVNHPPKPIPLAGGLQKIAPLFAPIDQALLQKLRTQTHRFADETRWAMFVLMAGKVG